MLYVIIKGVTLGLLLAISVGPVVFTVLKQSINNGTKGGLSFIAGVSVSDVALVVISNTFTELFKSLSNLKEEIGGVGSLFLIGVGIYFLFFKKVKVNEEGQQILQFRKRDYAKIFAAGVLMNTLNPSVIIFWLTTSTAFIDHSLQQRIVIFAIALLIVLGTDIAKVVLANKIRKRLTPKNIHLINQINGIILVVFGVALLWGLLFYSGKFS
jgi:threonine/homoserine/homoserine lactone efflux protein